MTAEQSFSSSSREVTGEATLYSRDAGTFCINGFKYEKPNSQIQIRFSGAHGTVCVSNAGPLTSGRMTIAGDFCLPASTPVPQKFVKDFNFIPQDAQVFLQRGFVTTEGLMDPKGIVETRSPMKLCSLLIPVSTEFSSVTGIDDQFHFKALRAGVMKTVNQAGVQRSLKIVKGKDYRNPRPADHPCNWTETPADLLNPPEDSIL